LHGESSEFFRVQHGDHQVTKQRHCNEADNDVFHWSLSELPAEADVEATDNEEGDEGANKN
jgi:hypothetical protein